MRTRIERWILLSGNRYVVAGGILVLMTAVVLVPGVTRFAIRNIDPLFYVGSVLVTGNITLITLVVAINQVVLSQELESPGQLRDEIERTAEYRQAALEGPTPSTEPAQFLRQLLQQTREHALCLEDLIPEARDEMSDEEGDNVSDEGGAEASDEEGEEAREDTGDEATDEATERLLVDLPDHCDELTDRVDQSDGLTSVVVPVFGVGYADYIHDCFQLQAKYGEDSHEQLHSALDDLTSDLKNADVARQYFASAFMKEELATLSRSLLYVSVLAVSVPIALLLQLTTYSGAAPPMSTLFVIAVLVVIFGLAPLSLLIAFVVRIATVADYIAVIMPFEV